MRGGRGHFDHCGGVCFRCGHHSLKRGYGQVQRSQYKGSPVGDALDVQQSGRWGCCVAAPAGRGGQARLHSHHHPYLCSVTLTWEDSP